MQHKDTIQVLIVGAGIIGMTTAYQMLKDGYQNVSIISKDKPLETNSDVAAALWRPYGAEPIKDALAWSEQSYSDFFDIYYEYLRKKARTRVNSVELLSSPGISFVIDVEYFGPKDTQKPDWMNNADKLLVDKIALLEKDKYSDDVSICQAATELLEILKEQQEKIPTILNTAPIHPSRPERYASVVPLIDSTIYRKWLLQQYEEISKKKVEFRAEGVGSLEEGSKELEKLAEEYDIIINCAGEQARHLTSEAHTNPIRGLVVISKIPEKLDYCIGVEPNQDLDHGAINITYAIIRPESHTCIMGGTYENIPDSLFSNEEKKQNDAEKILDNIIALIPDIKNKSDLNIIDIREGFRCGRAKMCSDVKKICVQGKSIIMAGALGHGGGGYSVSHGVGNDITKKCNALLLTLNEQVSQEYASSQKRFF